MAAHKGSASLKPMCTRSGSSVAAISLHQSTCFGSDQPSSGKMYINFVDLHNEYLRATGSHVAFQYFGNIHNEWWAG
jgi:hypothetical protein